MLTAGAPVVPSRSQVMVVVFVSAHRTVALRGLASLPGVAWKKRMVFVVSVSAGEMVIVPLLVPAAIEPVPLLSDRSAPVPTGSHVSQAWIGALVAAGTQLWVPSALLRETIRL